MMNNLENPSRVTLLKLISLSFSVVVSLSSGTLYLYGLYAPQLIRRVGLSTSDSATISLAMTLGSSSGGLPAGLLVDRLGPSKCIFVGAICVFTGYFGLYKIYEKQMLTLLLICISCTFIGFGSVLSFFGTLKSSQANFPKHRGAAGAFPVGAFGLSAILFSLIANSFYNNDTQGLLRFFSIFCSMSMLLGSFFIHVYPDQDEIESKMYQNDSDSTNSLTERSIENPSSSAAGEYGSISKATDRKMADVISLRGSLSFWGIGRRSPRSSISSDVTEVDSIIRGLREQNKTLNTPNETPLMSRQSSYNSIFKVGPAAVTSNVPYENPKLMGPLQIIKKRLSSLIFYEHYFMISVFAGIAQMYIYSIGFIAIAQTSRHVDSISISSPELDSSAQNLQALQVSIISITSFSGRIFGGVFSDFIYRYLHIQRIWIIVSTTLVLALGQLLMILNERNVHLISVASSIIGFSYGLMYGTYPAVIADEYGTKTFTTTWGLAGTGSLVVLFGLNKFFGHIYDINSDPLSGICHKGNGCYKGAFELSINMCFVLFALGLVIMYRQKKRTAQ